MKLPKIKFGPAGLGGINEAEKNLEYFKKNDIECCEVAFTYGVYIKKEEDAKKIGKAAKKFGIELSIHAPYYINLNSNDEEKIKKSKERILECCKIGELMNAKLVVFHPGFYGKNKEEAYENIKNAITDIQDEIKNQKWKIKLAPETMGKINVFGSIEEIRKLVDETKCSFCLDFAHILAREKKVDYDKIKKLFKEKEWHCHFSGIVYNEKGERYHKVLEKKEIEELILNLPINKKIRIINESPSPIEDSLKCIKVYKNLFKK